MNRPRSGPREVLVEQAVGLLEGYVEAGDSAPLEAFAEAALPTVKAHLEEARKLLE